MDKKSIPLIQTLSFWVELSRTLPRSYDNHHKIVRDISSITHYEYQDLLIEFSFDCDAVDQFDPDQVTIYITYKKMTPMGIQTYNCVITITKSGQFYHESSEKDFNWLTHNHTIMSLQSKINLKEKLKNLK